MSLTQTPTAPATAPDSALRARRVAAAASVLLAVSLFLTVASVNVPHDVSDAELLEWWQLRSNRMGGLVSGFASIGVAACFAVVTNHLRSLPAASKAPQWLAFVASMSAAVSAVWLVTGAAHAVIGHHVDVMHESLPGVDVLRFGMAFNYALLDLSGMAVLGLGILATSVVVLRTGALGRWLGYVGAGCVVVILAAVVVQLGAYATPVAILWALCLAAAIWREPSQIELGQA